MTVYISSALRRHVRADAGSLCGYCHSAEQLTGMPLEFEHLTPLAADGQTTRDNLWLSCHRCNEFKGNRTHGLDPESGAHVLLFNPRTQRWREHFQWSSDSTLIVGLTACGRATVESLQLNNAHVATARYYWASGGWHPPADDV